MSGTRRPRPISRCSRDVDAIRARAPRRYGDAFVGVDVLLKQHLANYTASGYCSPMHAWISFLTGHAAFSLELEKSMRAVDPDARRRRRGGD